MRSIRNVTVTGSLVNRESVVGSLKLGSGKGKSSVTGTIVDRGSSKNISEKERVNHENRGSKVVKVSLEQGIAKKQ